MSITLTRDGVTLALDADLRWVDEFAWSPTVQSRQRSITGALLIDSGAAIGGRPITLRPDDNDSGWMSRATALQLAAWASGDPEAEMTLSINGEAHTVRFRHPSDESGEPAVSAEPMVFFSDPQPSHQYLVTLRLITV